ncbi:MAG TPA: hypothetical protein VNX25_03620, partial [Verrucomicrobiae bacterium]|nr:hypothetical protein [Verrucomicrobiae bacterium]
MMKPHAVVAGVLFAVLVLVVTVLYRFGPIFTPLFLAFTLAWLLAPAVDRLQRAGLRRGIAV